MAHNIMFFVMLLTLQVLPPVRQQNSIPDDVVIMDIEPVLLRGRQGDLQCRFKGVPIAVYWLKGDDIDTAEDLITFHLRTITILLEKNRGLYNMSDKYSLVINSVTDDNAGKYFCRVSDYRGYTIRSHTVVTVKVPPDDPYPTIVDCPTGEPCSVDIGSADSTNLACRTDGASPSWVALSWTGGCPLGGTQTTKITPGPNVLTETVAVTISARPCDDVYKCVAKLNAIRVDGKTAIINITSHQEIVPTMSTTTSIDLRSVVPVLSPGEIFAGIIFIVPNLLLVVVATLLLCYCTMFSSTSYSGALNGCVCLWLTFSLCICCVAQSSNIKHDFISHANVTLTFQHELTAHAYLCNVIVHGSDHPIVVNEKIMDDHLKPGQMGRFSVQRNVSRDNILTIVININNIDITDEGVYTLTIIEPVIGTVHQYNQSVHVTYPPGPARCFLSENQSTNGDWHTVFCNATAGRIHGKGSGYIVCYQHSKQASYLQPVTYSDNYRYITAVYWMDPTLEMKCCSTYNSSDHDPESCDDFLYTPAQRDRPSPDNPDYSTKTSTSLCLQLGCHTNTASDNAGNQSSAVLITLVVAISILIDC